MGIGEIWVDFNCPPDHGEGFFQLATILMDQAQQIECFGVIGLSAQDFLIKLFRLVEVSRRMAFNRRVEFGVGIKILCNTQPPASSWVACSRRGNPPW